MDFQSYTNVFSRVSRNVATGIFILGMVLIGLGFLIWVLCELFAILFAIIFCLVGIGCCIKAVKIFWAAKKIDGMSANDGRMNVHVRQEQHYE